MRRDRGLLLALLVASLVRGVDPIAVIGHSLLVYDLDRLRREG
jgi:hypothetical protein